MIRPCSRARSIFQTDPPPAAFGLYRGATNAPGCFDAFLAGPRCGRWSRWLPLPCIWASCARSGRNQSGVHPSAGSIPTIAATSAPNPRRRRSTWPCGGRQNDVHRLDRGRDGWAPETLPRALTTIRRRPRHSPPAGAGPSSPACGARAAGPAPRVIVSVIATSLHSFIKHKAMSQRTVERRN